MVFFDYVLLCTSKVDMFDYMPSMVVFLCTVFECIHLPRTLRGMHLE